MGVVAIGAPNPRTTMLPQPATLVSIGAAVAALGVDRERLREWVDEGRLRWVFDLRGGSRLPCFRFWLAELKEPKAVRSLSWEQALSRIIPMEVRQRIASLELARLFDMSNVYVWERRQAGVLRGTLEHSRRWIELSSVRQWLRSNWLSCPDAANHFASPEAFSTTMVRTSDGARRHRVQEQISGERPFSSGDGPESRCGTPGAISAVLALPRPQKLKLKAVKGLPEPFTACSSG